MSSDRDNIKTEGRLIAGQAYAIPRHDNLNSDQVAMNVKLRLPGTLVFDDGTESEHNPIVEVQLWLRLSKNKRKWYSGEVDRVGKSFLVRRRRFLSGQGLIRQRKLSRLHRKS